MPNALVCTGYVISCAIQLGQQADSSVQRQTEFAGPPGNDSLPSDGQPCGASFLSLDSSQLTDQLNRTCEIASDYRLHCDINGGQTNAITKNNFAICDQNHLAVGGRSVWVFCSRGKDAGQQESWNTYSGDLQVEGVGDGIPKQCVKGTLRTVNCIPGQAKGA